MKELKVTKNNGEKITGLIVDDSKFIHILMKRIFKLLDIEVVGTAEDGVEAIEQFQKLKPDFVTLDITMPRLNGLQALVKMKSINPTAKIVMVSSFGPDKILKECIFKGALNFIQKPFSVEDAAKKLNVILNKAYDNN
jgi:two-component system, chemotaxis family, chemotaxis protein CheY